MIDRHRSNGVQPASVPAGPGHSAPRTAAGYRDGRRRTAIDSVDRKKIIAASHARLVIITPSSRRVDSTMYGGRSDHTWTQETGIQQQCHGSNRFSLPRRLVSDTSSACHQPKLTKLHSQIETTETRFKAAVGRLIMMAERQKNHFT